MTFPTGLLFGLLAMLGYGLADVLSALPARKLGIKRLAFWRNLWLTIILLAFAFVFSPIPKTSGWWWLFAIAIALFGYIPLATFYRGLQLGKVGIIVPIAKSAFLITVLLAAIFLDETFSIFRVVAIIAIFLGIMLLTIHFEDIKRSELFSLRSGVLFALLSCLLWGFGYFLFKYLVLHFGPWLAALLVEGGVFVTASMFLIMPKEREAILTPPQGAMRWYIIALVIVTLIGTISYMLGISTADVSIVAPLASSGPIISVPYSRLILKERLRPLQYAGALLTIAGIVMMAM